MTVGKQKRRASGSVSGGAVKKGRGSRKSPGLGGQKQTDNGDEHIQEEGESPTSNAHAEASISEEGMERDIEPLTKKRSVGRDLDMDLLNSMNDDTVDLADQSNNLEDEIQPRYNNTSRTGDMGTNGAAAGLSRRLPSPSVGLVHRVEGDQFRNQTSNQRDGGRENELVKVIHELKANIAQLRKDNKQLHKFIEVLEESKKDKYRELDRVRAENGVLRNAAAHGRSRSRSMDKFGPTSTGMSPALKETLSIKRKLIGSGIENKFIPSVYAVHEDMRTMGRHLAMEIIQSARRKKIAPVDWFPNAATEDIQVVREWRGRVLMVKGCGDIPHVAEVPNIHPLGAIFYNTSTGEDNLKSFTTGAVPLCPMTISRDGQFFTTSERNIKDLIADTCSEVYEAENQEYTAEDVVLCRNQASESLVLHNKLLKAAGEYIGARKKALKTTFFQLLGFEFIVKTYLKSETDEETKERLLQHEEAHKRLLRKDWNGRSQTDWWRTALFEDICSSVTEPVTNREVTGEDILFRNEPARRAFEAFRGRILEPDDDASIMTLIRVDAWITAVIEDLSRKKSVSDLGKRGGMETLVLRERYKTLLVESAENLLQCCCRSLMNSVKESTDSRSRLRMEFTVGKHKEMERRLRNNVRLHTIAFQYPGNNHFYIAVRHETFTSLICSWYGKVQDCYILFSRGRGHPMQKFEVNYEFDALHDSDEEIIDSTARTSSERNGNGNGEDTGSNILDLVDIEGEDSDGAD